MLRSEMMEDYKQISQYNVALYTVTATILTFALGRSEYYLCLVPYLVAVPLFLMCEAKRKDICKIASYLAVYLEGDEFNWETRHQLLEEYDGQRRNWQSLLIYYLIPITCSGLSIYRIVYNYSNYGMWNRIVSVIILTLGTLILMGVKTISYVSFRKNKRQEWKKHKAYEEIFGLQL